MSSAGALDRSTLDRKDRAELQTIAQAMGVKPPSRARKADIVDLILELAGSPTDGDTSGGDGSKDDAPTSRRGSKRAEDDDSGDNDGDNDGDDDNDGDKGNDNRGDTGSGGRADSGTRDHQDGRQAPQDDRSRSRNGDRNQAQNNRGQNNQSQNNRTRQDGAQDAGNRKRRRRGRGTQEVREDEVAAWNGEPIAVAGFLDLRDDGYGFLRINGVLPSKADVYVPIKQVRDMGLRRGDFIEGTSRPANRNEKNPALLSVEHINHDDPKKAKNRPHFEDLTPLFPDENLRLERPSATGDMTCRIIDLIAPIGKGQRGLIVSPPKAGKTSIMKEIVRSIEINNPEVTLFVLLVDERPEEVTDMRRWLDKGEVVASTFDKPTEEHTAAAEITIERAKRLVEMGKDVVVILDGITRLARAYNLAAPATGRVMSGGVDAGALYPPKRFFGAARNVEEGGSLTILATALVDTGSKMDEVIFEEFKGTGNMELRLDRRTAERRVYPAIDVDASSTRHEELLFSPKQLNQVWKLRRVLSGMVNDEDASRGRGNAAGLELLIDRLKTFKTNDAFLEEIAKGG